MADDTKNDSDRMRAHWAGESEAFSRVMSAMEDGTAQITQKYIGEDEGNQPIYKLAITAGGHPGYDTLFLDPTPQEGVYQFSTPNQVAGGMIHGAIQADPETGKYAPVQDFTKQIQYTPGQSGSFLGNLAGTFGDMYKSLGPIGGILGNAIAPGLGSALSAIAAIDEGNTTGGVMNALGAAGAYGNAALQAGDTSGLGGTLAENLPEIKTATNALQLANAAQTGNIGSALSAAGNLTGVSADPTIKTAIQTVGLVQALDSGNTAQALLLAGQLTDNPDVKVAGDALKLVNAINNGNPLAVQNAAISLAKSTGADDVANNVDQKTIDAVLDSPANTELTNQDIVNIVQGTDTATGGAGADSVSGGEATTQGGTGEDTIVSDTGSDTLLGGTGEDSVVGGEATTQGGAGTDTMDAGDGSDVIADDGTTTDIQKVIDDLGTTDTADTTKTTGTTKTTTTNTGGGTGATQTTATPALAPATSSGMDLLGLLALMGGGGQQAQPAQPTGADLSNMVDIENLLANPLQVDPRKTARQSKMAEGGSIDDLLALLDKRS